MARHVNIPIFIPHEGCPNDCVFCNQRTITGQSQKADRDIIPEIESALSTYDGDKDNIEIAFFGGSFTGIDRDVMTRLLEAAYSYVKRGIVSSIRLSTRPDYIDDEVLHILKSHGVRHIELGIQSMSDMVLKASNRGHSAEATRRSCSLIKKYGFDLTGQMMIGLPLSSMDDEIYTANEIVAMGCDSARIYPTVVFENTRLCHMAKIGDYAPLSVDEAITRSTAVYEIFLQNGIQVIRIGLQASESLTSGDGIYAGANHSALGELIIGEHLFNIIKRKIYSTDFPKEIDIFTIKCKDGRQSGVAGQNKRNKIRIRDIFQEKGISVKEIKIRGDASLNAEQIEFDF